MGAFKLLQAAGVIHNDFERGFIKAETTAYADLVEFGGEQGAKEKGKVRMLGNNCAFVHAHITRASTHTHTHTHTQVRMEGKDYVVADGDCILFRFNV